MKELLSSELVPRLSLWTLQDQHDYHSCCHFYFNTSDVEPKRLREILPHKSVKEVLEYTFKYLYTAQQLQMRVLKEATSKGEENLLGFMENENDEDHEEDTRILNDSDENVTQRNESGTTESKNINAVDSADTLLGSYKLCQEFLRQ